MNQRQTRNRITDNTPVTAITASCAITQIVIAVEDPGTTWKLKIQDKHLDPDPPHDPLPFVLCPSVDLASPDAPTPMIINFVDPVYMDGGVVIDAAGTAGVVNVWISFWA